MSDDAPSSILPPAFSRPYTLEDLLVSIVWPTHTDPALSYFEILISSIFVWYFSCLVDWVLHTMSHIRTNIPLWKQINRIHMAHHKDHYPVSSLLKPEPYIDGGGSWAFGPLIIMFWVVFFLVFRPKVAVLMIVESASFTYASDYLHMHFHIKGSHLEKYDWFIQRRYRHFYHHGALRMNMSLGGIDPIADKTFGTYVEVIVDPANKSKVPRRKIEKMK